MALAIPAVALLLLVPPAQAEYLSIAEPPVPLPEVGRFFGQLRLAPAQKQVAREVLGEIRKFAAREKWNPTMLAIDVDPVTLL